MKPFARSFILARVPVLAALVGMAGCSSETPTRAEPTAAGTSGAARAYRGALVANLGPIPSTPGGFTVQRLARGNFLDEIGIKFTIKEGHGTKVVNVRDPSDVLVARLTFQSGGSSGWHTHYGPVIVTVASGALTLIDADDCEPRVYTAGTAFVDPGQGNVHLAFNGTADETVAYATFLDVPAGHPPTSPAGNPGCQP